MRISRTQPETERRVCCPVQQAVYVMDNDIANRDFDLHRLCSGFRFNSTCQPLQVGRVLLRRCVHAGSAVPRVLVRRCSVYLADYMFGLAG